MAGDDDDWHEHPELYSEDELELRAFCPDCAILEYA